MKKALFIVIALLAVSCGPSRYALHLEMRQPSKSGVDLGGKLVSVVYSSIGDEAADTFAENMADAFAEALEKDYGTGEGSVGLYAVDGTQGDYSQRDSLVSILISTGADVVFLFASPQFQGKSSEDSQSVLVRLYCYDGMNKEDKVQAFTGTTTIDKSQVSEAAKAGTRVADSFLSQWKPEQYSFAYFDSVKWYEALSKAEQYDWKAAMDIWFSLLDSNDPLKRSSAEYNIAVACYLMGDFSLAEQWLDRSDADSRISLFSDGLRKRLELRKK